MGFSDIIIKSINIKDSSYFVEVYVELYVELGRYIKAIDDKTGTELKLEDGLERFFRKPFTEIINVDLSNINHIFPCKWVDNNDGSYLITIHRYDIKLQIKLESGLSDGIKNRLTRYLLDDDHDMLKQTYLNQIQKHFDAVLKLLQHNSTKRCLQFLSDLTIMTEKL